MDRLKKQALYRLKDAYENKHWLNAYLVAVAFHKRPAIFLSLASTREYIQQLSKREGKPPSRYYGVKMWG